MTSKDKAILRDFIIQHLGHLRYDGGGGGRIDFPSFEFTPLDYLRFAQNEIGNDETRAMSVQSSLNCVNHLKRSADCAIDTFLYVLHLYDLFKKRNLKFEKKIELLNSMGLFNPRSLNKLNTMRNKMEHEYRSPESTNLDLYFELIQGFVYALDGSIHMLAHDAEMDFVTQDDIDDALRSMLGLKVEYVFEKPSVTFELWDHGKIDNLEFVASDNIENFAFAVNVFFLLIRSKALISAETVIENLLRAYNSIEKGNTIRHQNAG